MTRKNWLEVAKEKGLLVTHGRDSSAADDRGDLTTTLNLVEQQGFGRAVPEYFFARPRRQFRFDFAWPDRKVALEREGGRFVCVVCPCGLKRTVFVSRHTDREGYERDVLKYSLAAILGWAVVRVTPRMIESGQAAELVLGALRARGES